MAAITIRNGYVSLSALKSKMGLTSVDAARDNELGACIETASREVEGHCGGRQFYPSVETRYFTPSTYRKLLCRDILSVTALDTDDALDRTYSYNWALTDYELGPYNNRAQQRPYLWIEIKPLGQRWFTPGLVESARVAAVWGFDNSTELPGVTLGAAITTTTATTATVAAGTGTLLSIGDRILIDSEQILITDIATDTLTIIRGWNGTTAATHLNAATVSRYVPPLPIRTITRDIAANIFHGPNAPQGATGPAEMGFTMFGTAFNKRIRDLQASYRIPVVA